jgi:hypothetical protein
MGKGASRDDRGQGMFGAAEPRDRIGLAHRAAEGVDDLSAQIGANRNFKWPVGRNNLRQSANTAHIRIAGNHGVSALDRHDFSHPFVARRRL